MLAEDGSMVPGACMLCGIPDGGWLNSSQQVVVNECVAQRGEPTVLVRVETYNRPFLRSRSQWEIGD